MSSGSDKKPSFSGFSLGSSNAPVRRPAPVNDAMEIDSNSDERVTILTAVGPSGALVANRKEAKKDDFLVIPLEEGWKVKRKPAFDPTKPMAPESDAMVEEGEAAPAIPMLTDNSNGDENLPALLRNRIPGIDELKDEFEKFKADVDLRPPEASMDDYERVPIDKFGEGMLRGMGWTPGKPIGKYNKDVVQVVQFVRRPEGLGLGAKPRAMEEDEEDEKDKKKRRGDEDAQERRKRRQREDAASMMALPVGADGKVRHVRGIDEQLVRVKEPFYEGCRVAIVDGPHAGLRATLIRRRGMEASAVLRLVSEETVTVPLSHLAELPEGASLHSDAKRDRDDRDKRDRYKDRDDDRERERERERERRKRSRSRSPDRDADRKRPRVENASSSSSSSSSSTSSAARAVWVCPDIRVKIVSKTLQGGRLYAKSAWIVDVLPGARCSLRLDDGGQLVQDVKETELETLVPQLNGRVRIVSGQHRGERGTVVDRDRDKRRVQVRLDDDDSVVALPFDDCAQTQLTLDD